MFSTSSPRFFLTKKMSSVEERMTLGEETNALFREFKNLEYEGSCRQALEPVFACCDRGQYMDPFKLKTTLEYCERYAQEKIRSGEGCGFTEAEITAMLLYFAESKDNVRGSFRAALNSVLRNQNTEAIKPFKHIIWLLLWAMKESPSFDGVVFRGVNADISEDYIVGETIVYRQFTACTKDKDVSMQELSRMGEEGKRVIIEITPTTHRARSISLLPGEETVMFPPHTSFLVEAKVAEGNGLVRILLTEKPSRDLILDFEDSAVKHQHPTTYFCVHVYPLISPTYHNF